MLFPASVMTTSLIHHYAISHWQVLTAGLAAPIIVSDSDDDEYPPTPSSQLEPDGKSAARGEKADSERMGSTASSRGAQENVSLTGVLIYCSSSALIPRKAGSALLYNIP